MLASQPDPSLVVSPLASRHGPVTNIFPYSADGKPLSGVLLYDQDGRPLHVSKQIWSPDPCARVVAPPVAADGVAIPQNYPQHYVRNGSGLTTWGEQIAPHWCTAVAIPKVLLPKVGVPIVVSHIPLLSRKAAQKPALAQTTAAPPS